MENTEGKFMFSGHETLFGRVGLWVRPEHMTEKDALGAMKEIEDLYKHKYGYKCVRVLRNKNDPLMVDVYVIPNRAKSCRYY
jgi:hypothetical protein